MWQSNSYTDTGQVRQKNEDAVLDLGNQNLWLVADGMGGHSNGAYASQLVRTKLLNYTSSHLTGISKQRLVRALDGCNARLIEKAIQDQVDVIGCTVAVLQTRLNSIICSWSGDSRIYRLRDNKLKQLTRDHSQQSAMEDRDLLRYPSQPLACSQSLTGAIGGASRLSLEQCWYQLRDKDAFLLCTDGLNKEVTDDEISALMAESPEGELVLEKLYELYRQRGARDNVAMVWVARSSS